MKSFLSIMVVALAASGLFISDVDAKSATGACNSILATHLRTAQECTRMSCEPGSAQCIDITNAFVEFVGTEGCVEAFQNGELKGLGGRASTQPAGPKAGEDKHIGQVICGSVRDCGLCPSALAFGICPSSCL